MRGTPGRGCKRFIVMEDQFWHLCLGLQFSTKEDREERHSVSECPGWI